MNSPYDPIKVDGNRGQQIGNIVVVYVSSR